MDQQRKLAFKFCKMNCGLWIGMDQQRKLVFKFWKIVDWDEKVDFKVLGNELQIVDCDGSTEKVGFQVLEK